MKEGFESFSAYRFSMDYPEVCRIEFNPKSSRERGDITFHFPDHERIFLSWGKLEDAQRKSATVEEQAERSIKAASKSSRTKNTERVKQDSVKINSHRAAYNYVRIEEPPRGFFPSKQKIKRDVMFLHLRCEPLSRYFVICAMPTRNAPEDFEELFLEMARTFKCHETAR